MVVIGCAALLNSLALLVIGRKQKNPSVEAFCNVAAGVAFACALIRYKTVHLIPFLFM
jgi:hypothetical protein